MISAPSTSTTDLLYISVAPAKHIYVIVPRISERVGLINDVHERIEVIAVVLNPNNVRKTSVVRVKKPIMVGIVPKITINFIGVEAILPVFKKVSSEIMVV